MQLKVLKKFIFITISIISLIETKRLPESAEDSSLSSLRDAVSALASSGDSIEKIKPSSYINSNSKYIKRDDLESKSINKKVAQTQQCQEITVPMCRNMEYNMTSMPNQFNHFTQQEAAMEAHQFWALVEINCSKDLRFFLCSMYTPICLPNYAGQPVRPCKSVCVRARLGCEKYMKKFGFEWPDHMNCDLFPEYGSSNHICMDPMDQQSSNNKKLIVNHKMSTENVNGRYKQSELSTTLSPNKIIKPIVKMLNNDFNEAVDEQDLLTLNQAATISKSINDYRSMIQILNDALCVQPFGKSTNTKDSSIGYLNSCYMPRSAICIKQQVIGTDSEKDLMSQQQQQYEEETNVYFNKWQQGFTHYWLICWTILCLTSSLCTTCSYLIDSSRFKYPEKPIIYLSMCYLFVSFGYIIRYVIGNKSNVGSCEHNLIDQDTNSNFKCILTFIFIYYFGMASSVWWVIVSLTWFLAAGLKWSYESIGKYVKWFHLIAWLLPLIQTCLVLSLSFVDMDQLTGICYVGNLNTQSMRMFVLMPSIVYLTLGITFLIAGFVSLIRLRNMIVRRQQNDLKKAHKIEKLMIRIGIFSILYTVPATCVICCQFYEQYYRADWEKSLLCKNYYFNNLNDADQDPAKLKIINTFCTISNNNQQQQNFISQSSPDFSIFMLKYFMSLIIGVTSGFWIWTSKTINSWQLFFYRRFSCCFITEADTDKKSNKNNGSSCKAGEEETVAENNNYNQDKVIEKKIKCCFYFKSAKKESTDINEKKFNENIQRQRDSVVFFQPMQQHQQPQPVHMTLKIDQENNNNNQHYYEQQHLLFNSNCVSNNMLNPIQLPINSAASQVSPIRNYQKQADSIISLRFNSANNTVSTQQNNYYPISMANMYAHQQLQQQQQKFNSNKSTACYYDFCSSSLSTNVTSAGAGNSNANTNNGTATTNSSKCSLTGSVKQ